MLVQRQASEVGANQVTLTISGPPKETKVLLLEAGGHRIQRIPPTEKKGRVHTSTVTVAVMVDYGQPLRQVYPESDFRIEWFSGSGAGGQHRNKHANSCRLIHIPTGLKQESQCRSRRNSYESAKKALIALLDADNLDSIAQDANGIRRTQVGSGMRSDKVRTYRFQEDSVVDHNSHKRASCKKVMAGKFDLMT